MQLLFLTLKQWGSDVGNIFARRSQETERRATSHNEYQPGKPCSFSLSVPFLFPTFFFSFIFRTFPFLSAYFPLFIQILNMKSKISKIFFFLHVISLHDNFIIWYQKIQCGKDYQISLFLSLNKADQTDRQYLCSHNMLETKWPSLVKYVGFWTLQRLTGGRCLFFLTFECETLYPPVLDLGTIWHFTTSK